MTVKSSKPKLDIRDVLNAVDMKDYDFLNKLPEPLRNAFTPYTAMRWVSGVDLGEMTPEYLNLVNTCVNLDYGDLSGHPELIFKLLAACGLGTPLRHQWIAPARRLRQASALENYLAGHWPEANYEELNIVLQQFTRDSFSDFLDSCGHTQEEKTKHLDGYDAYYGIRKETKKAARK